MSKQCNGVPSQNPRHRSSGTPTSFIENKKLKEDRKSKNVHEDIYNARRRHSSPNPQHKRSSNDPLRSTPFHQKNKSANYKKNRSTSASRLQQYGNTPNGSNEKEKYLEHRWWNDQIRVKGGSGPRISQTGRGRSGRYEEQIDSLAEHRKDDRGNAFQVSPRK